MSINPTTPVGQWVLNLYGRIGDVLGLDSSLVRLGHGRGDDVVLYDRADSHIQLPDACGSDRVMALQYYAILDERGRGIVVGRGMSGRIGGMTKQQVLDAAMALDDADRAEVLDVLSASVPPADDDAPLSPEWEAEIKRRIEQVDHGEVQLIDGDEAIRQARARLVAARQTKIAGVA